MVEYTGFVVCPSCGSKKIEVYEKNGMLCKSCGYVYFHNTASAVGAVIEMGGGVLLAVRANEPGIGLYDLPGGFVDYRESAEEALLREIREELHIDVAITEYLGSFSNRYEYKNVVYFTCDAFFVCRPVIEEAVVRPNGEIRSWDVFPLEKIPFHRFAFDSNVKVLERYCALHASR